MRGLIEQGENLDVEFKSDQLRPFDDRELVEAVVCLANRMSTRTGWLVIGVEDDGRVTGARPRHGEYTDPLRLQALIANRTRPALSCSVHCLSLQEGEVIVIEVAPSRVPVGTSEGVYLRRGLNGRGRPACLPFHFHEMQAMLSEKALLDYSALPVPGATWEHLDPLEFERFRRFVRESRGAGDSILLELPDVELAKALGAVEVHQEEINIRVLALLLFGKEEALGRYLPTHEVAFQVLSDDRVEVNEFFRLPLLRVVDELLMRFRARNSEQEIQAGALRVGVPNYSERAYREAVANALVHRDYTMQGAVHVQWYPDRIEISNPGGFPEGVHPANILVVPPKPRSPLLADAFKRAGIVERTGRGVDIIFYEQLRNGRPAPTYERSSASTVVLVLPGGEANLNFVRLVVEQSQSNQPLALDDLLVLNALYQQRSITPAEVASLIQKSQVEARSVLGRLVDRGFIEKRGGERSRSYILSAQVYRSLSQPSAYVRQKGFDALQQEQMILAYLNAHGKITRRETAELCKLSSSQASRLLRRMTQKGILQLVGSKKGAFYTLAGQGSR